MEFVAIFARRLIPTEVKGQQDRNDWWVATPRRHDTIYIFVFGREILPIDRGLSLFSDDRVGGRRGDDRISRGSTKARHSRSELETIDPLAGYRAPRESLGEVGRVFLSDTYSPIARSHLGFERRESLPNIDGLVEPFVGIG
jgi:hypothetical protein